LQRGGAIREYMPEGYNPVYDGEDLFFKLPSGDAVWELPTTAPYSLRQSGNKQELVITDNVTEKVERTPFSDVIKELADPTENEWVQDILDTKFPGYYVEYLRRQKIDKEDAKQLVLDLLTPDDQTTYLTLFYPTNYRLKGKKSQQQLNSEARAEVRQIGINAGARNKRIGLTDNARLTNAELEALRQQRAIYAQADEDKRVRNARRASDINFLTKRSY